MLQTFFGLGQTAELEIILDRPDGKKKLDEISKKDQSLIYYDGETVSGKVIFIKFRCIDIFINIQK